MQETMGQHPEAQAEIMSPAQIEEQVQKLQLLDTERADLGYKIYQFTGQTRAQREEAAGAAEEETQKREGQVEEKAVAEESLSLEDEQKLILEGKIGQIRIKQNQEESARQEVIVALEQRRSEVEAEIANIAQNPEVMARYDEFRQSKIAILKNANEAHQLESYFEQLDRQEAGVLRKSQKSLTTPEGQYLDRLNKLRATAVRRLQALEQNPEVADALRLHELLDYKNQLEKGHFAETPSRKEYMSKVMNRWLQGKHVMLTGPTGTGKTEIFRELLRKFWHQELSSTLISGSQTVTDYTLFGKPGGMKAGTEGGMDVYFTPAGFTVGMQEGLPVIMDEFDLLDTNTRLRLKALYNFRPGDEYTVQEDTSYKIRIKEGFCIGATANIKSEKHKERFALDPAENRVWDEERIDYLPKEELLDLCLASLMDRRGRLPLNLKTSDGDSLVKLVDAATFIQETYMGKQTQIFEEGGATKRKHAILEQAVLDPGKVLGFLNGWNQARARGEDFQGFLEEQLLSFANKEGYPEKDRRLLAQIFIQKYGFFAEHGVQEFLIPGLTEKQLASWRTAKTQEKEEAQ